MARLISLSRMFGSRGMGSLGAAFLEAEKAKARAYQLDQASADALNAFVAQGNPLESDVQASLDKWNAYKVRFAEKMAMTPAQRAASQVSLLDTVKGWLTSGTAALTAPTAAGAGRGQGGQGQAGDMASYAIPIIGGGTLAYLAYRKWGRRG